MNKVEKIHVMVDIETLGTKSLSTIFQISAVAFKMETGEVVHAFDAVANIEKNKSMVVDGSTILWWLKTDAELLKKLLVEKKSAFSSEDILKKFHAWLKDLTGEYGFKNVYLWGNGPLFDNKMIQAQFENIGLDYPIFYRNDRCLRTLVEVACDKLGVDEFALKDQVKAQVQGFHAHDAFQDVLFQTRLAVLCYGHTTGNEVAFTEKLEALNKLAIGFALNSLEEDNLDEFECLGHIADEDFDTPTIDNYTLNGYEKLVLVRKWLWRKTLSSGEELLVVTHDLGNTHAVFMGEFTEAFVKSFVANYDAPLLTTS